MSAVLDYLPRGNTLDDREWHRRHRLLEWVLAAARPGLFGFGVLLGLPPAGVAEAIASAGLPVLGHLVTHRRWASFFITGGLVFCSVALVLLTSGSIEAHFHFFIIIGFIALYQDWVPFLWNVAFTMLSHGVGTIWLGGPDLQPPRGAAAPVAVVVHPRRRRAVRLRRHGDLLADHRGRAEPRRRRWAAQLITADAEIGRRQFTSDMLVNLARRNQSMLYRQLDIINELEDKERDPDALADLFKLDHLATRVRRNAESLLVLAGEQAPRTWSEPVAAARRHACGDRRDRGPRPGRCSPSTTARGLRRRRRRPDPPARRADRERRPVLPARDRGDDPRRGPTGATRAATCSPSRTGASACRPTTWPRRTSCCAAPRDVDLAVSQRLGFHVVARLADAARDRGVADRDPGVRDHRGRRPARGPVHPRRSRRAGRAAAGRGRVRRRAAEHAAPHDGSGSPRPRRGAARPRRDRRRSPPLGRSRR